MTRPNRARRSGEPGSLFPPHLRRVLMVICPMSQRQAFFQELPAALAVDVQAGLDGVGGGLLPEDAAHVMEHLENTSGGVRVGYRPMCLFMLAGRSFWLRDLGTRQFGRSFQHRIPTRRHRPFCFWAVSLVLPQPEHLPDDHIAHGLELLLLGERQSLGRMLRVGAAHLLPH